ncbi:DUF4132 domain-containing protein [Streptomyces sp. NPDC059894]|uniref:DUF4132 domain-containing protein n=1 Tax=unclassified Streptomyces TaxID=2593676 RepID=UPI00366A214B
MAERVEDLLEPGNGRAERLRGRVDVTRRLARGIEETLSAGRRRPYAPRDENRRWPHAEWARHYRDHPLTGALVRSLVREYAADEGAWTAGLPHPAGLLTPDGRVCRPARASAVRRR